MDMGNIPASCWIWTPEEPLDNGAPKTVLFRKVLTLDAAPEKAVVRLSADSRYRFYVNGVSVAFGPCKGDDKVWYYEETDIAPYLKAGENTLCAVVLRYSMIARGNHSIWRTANPGFYMKGEITTGDAAEPLNADASWRCHNAANIQTVAESKFQSFVFACERVKGDAALKGWMDADYADADWMPTREYHPFMMGKAVSPGNLMPRPIPFLFERAKRFTGLVCRRKSDISEGDWNALITDAKPLTIAPNSEEIVEINAGELTTGFLNLLVAGGADASIELLVSEAYATEDPTRGFNNIVKGDRTDYVNGSLHGNTDVFEPAGYGTPDAPEKYEPFWFRTFRFLQLKIVTKAEPVTIADVCYRETGYPLEVKTEVQTSDETMSDIWDISLRTLRRCMHETYEDCPFYEQLQYAMDTRSQILFTYAVSGDDRLALRCIDDFHRSLRYDGLTNCCYPSMGANVIPGFSLYYILMIHDHMMYFGDKAMVDKYMPTVDAILGFFKRSLDARGIVGKTGDVLGSRFWSFIDWTQEWNRTMGVPDAIKQGPITMESLMFVNALDISAELAEYTGRDGQAAGYRASAASLRKAINENCIGKNGLYQDGPGVDKYSQHCQVWAVLSDTAPKSEHRRLMETALSDKSLSQCSVAMAFYLFRAVEKAGLYDKTRELWKPWHKMLANHLTTCEEDPVNARSDCHAWGALALYEIPSVVLGVRPAAPGYAKVSIHPELGYLDSAKGRVITPRGEICVEAHRENGETKFTCKAPEGVEVV